MHDEKVSPVRMAFKFDKVDERLFSHSSTVLKALENRKHGHATPPFRVYREPLEFGSRYEEIILQ